MARGHNPLRDPRCLRRASGKPLLPSGLRGVLQYLCKQGACNEIQYRRGLTALLEVRMVWWGFSGVKDARKSVFIADASASATPFVQWTFTVQLLDIHCAIAVHLLSTC